MTTRTVENTRLGPPGVALEVLQRVKEAESPPLSDRQLAAELLVRGHAVARRTVAKYRAQLGIAAQPLR